MSPYKGCCPFNPLPTGLRKWLWVSVLAFRERGSGFDSRRTHLIRFHILSTQFSVTHVIDVKLFFSHLLLSPIFTSCFVCQPHISITPSNFYLELLCKVYKVIKWSLFYAFVHYQVKLGCCRLQWRQRKNLNLQSTLTNC